MTVCGRKGEPNITVIYHGEIIGELIRGKGNREGSRGGARRGRLALTAWSRKRHGAHAGLRRAPAERTGTGMSWAFGTALQAPTTYPARDLHGARVQDLIVRVLG
jgi:hypothetical protein